MGYDPSRLGRRSVLKTIAAGTVGSSLLVGDVAASSGSKFTGVAYDPATHKIIGDASGQFNRKKSELVGDLNVGGSKIHLNKQNPDQSRTIDGKRHMKYQHSTKAGKDNKLEKGVNIMGFKSGNLTGYMRQPNGNHVAFAIAPKKRGHAKKEMKHIVKKTSGFLGSEH